MRREYKTEIVSKFSAQVEKQKAEEDLKSKLKRLLIEGLTVKLATKIPERGFSTSTYKGKTCYNKVIVVLNRYSVSPEDFVWYVVEQDWSKVTPNIFILSSESFLSQVEWYFANKATLEGAKEILVQFSQVLGVRVYKGIRELQAANTILDFCNSYNITVTTFLSYIKGVNWRSGIPYISFFTTPSFFEQIRSKLNPIAKDSTKDYYLSQIPERLTTLSDRLRTEKFEETNWLLAEDIFMPLQPVLYTTTNLQLQRLVDRTLYEKHLEKFGKYVVTSEGKLTPLAFYWIVYASKQALIKFAPPTLQDWQLRIVEYVDRAVNLRILEE